MDFPYFEIELKPRLLENGKYKAGCSISEHTGDMVNVILSRWELKDDYVSQEAANKIMRLNALQYLKRENANIDMSKIRII